MKTTHKLELQQAGSGDHFNGRCTCGNWHCYPGRWHDSKKRIREAFRLHVADEKERARKTIERHESYGGRSTPIVTWRVWNVDHSHFMSFARKRDAKTYAEILPPHFEHTKATTADCEAAEARACPKKNPAADIGRDVETACSKLRRIAKELRAAGKHVKSPEFKTADDIEDVIALLEGDHLISVI